VSDLFVSTATRPPHRRGRLLVVAGVVIGVLVAGAAAVGGVTLAERGTIPAGTTVGGVDVGGKTRDQAEQALAIAARQAVERPIKLIGLGGEAQTSGRELGARPLVDDALDQALATSPLRRLLRRVGIGEAEQLELDYRLGPVRTAALANRLDHRFGEPPRSAVLVVEDGRTHVESAAQGTAVDRRGLRRALRTLPVEVGLSLITADPAVSTLAATSAQRRVDRLLDGPRSVRYGGVEARLSPRKLGSLVETGPRAGTLAVSLDPEGLAAALRPRLGRFERSPRDASFVPAGTRVRITPSRDGLLLDGERIGASLLKNLSARAHLARFVESPPELTTTAAKGLGIREPVSEFTTYHPCCAPRVSNIHRAADIMDGTIVLPGRRFSLNEVLGKRTVERGFVTAPQIFNGRLEDAVGGGVSQIATTTYNAAFFAGVQIVTHQPHQFYISRYPMGREATVSWGGPELIWRNDWPAAILVDTSYTDTSITVRFYSSKLGRRVETETGDPCCYVQPRSIVERNPALPAGAKSVIQEAGPAGFTISYTRKVFRHAKLRRNERYTWRYDAEDHVTEVGPPVAPKPAKPTPAAKQKLAATRKPVPGSPTQ
jgi:vancomycin resistance protein YoaR